MTLDVKANYFMGKALSEAKGMWFASLQPSVFAPAGFERYVFGAPGESASGESPSVHHLHGEFALSASGEARLEIEPPLPEDVTTPYQMNVSVEITDANQQTLSEHYSETRHPASFYLGIGRVDRLVSAGDSVELPIVCLDPTGARRVPDRPVELRVVRESWQTVKIETAGRGIRHRNERILTEISRREIAWENEEMEAAVTLPEMGTYHVTVASQDDAGRPVSSTLSLTAYGAGAVGWRGMDGVAMEVSADQPSYRPGDRARLLVKTPLDGTALITVERDRVLRSFTQFISARSPVIEVPIEEGDGPNVFVSVLMIHGSKLSPYEDGRPRARLGYADLAVALERPRLRVALATSATAYRPAEEVVIDTTVTDFQGRPVRDAEVTLFAVDEGVLSLLETPPPDPLAAFYPPQPHRVRTGTSLPNLLPDSRLLGYYGNKGIVIGDGGEAGLSNGYRSDFRACAYWNADLRTDAEGRVRAVFSAPDSLTRYRVTAVALGDRAWQFGWARSEFEVNKPVMLQPVVPRFAHVSDEIEIGALVHNQTESRHRFLVRLALGDLAVHGGASSGSERVRETEIALEPGASRSVRFPVSFTGVGETDWRWSVTSRESPEVSDAVVSVFPVNHPVPLRREKRLVTVRVGENSGDLLDGMDSELLAGEGTLEVTLSNTRIVEAAPAIEQMLTYPYG